MKLKVNLHFHTNDVPEDGHIYSFFEGMDRAAELGFDAISVTCHNKVVWNQKYDAYAAKCGILLIPGIELTVQKKHVLILNADPSIEAVTSFTELAEYKTRHPESFIMAPHPYYGLMSLGTTLEEHIALFDAIEHSWFYTSWFNLNKRARHVAETHNLPFIATSDTHDLAFLDTNYIEVQADEKTIPAIFTALKNKQFTNITHPLSTIREFIPYVFASQLPHTKQLLKRMF